LKPGIEAESSNNLSRKGSSKDVLRLLSYARPYILSLALASVSLLTATLLGLCFPKLVGDIADTAFVKKDAAGVNRLTIILIGVFVCQAAFSFLRSYLLSYAGERIVANVRKEVYAHLTTMPFSFFSSRTVGELTSRLASDVSVIQAVATGASMEFLRVSAILIGGITIVALRNTRLTLVMLAIIPLITICSRRYGRYIRGLSISVQDKLAEANSVLQETLSAIRIVQSFAREEHERARYGEKIGNALRLAVKRSLGTAGFIAFVILVMYGGIVVVLWFGSRMVVNNELTAGELVSFVLYSFFIGSAIGGLSELYGQVHSALGATRRVFEILDTKPDIANPPDAKPLKNVLGHVVLRDVWFSYPDERNVEVLKGISIEARPGEIIALVGPSGGGKSTLVSLIPRFYDVATGAIFIDGHDVRTIRLRDLREAIGLVPQETTLFSGPISENIAYGKLDATVEEIEAAARAAHAHEFVSAFPDGYRTVVGERGVKLSGGQRQRIAIARALLKDPAILILDEATSSLDSESERLIQDALETLMKGRTSLVIAHRLSTICHADRIIVIDGGRIIEEGSHNALIAKGGLYKQLHDIQFRNMPSRAHASSIRDSVGSASLVIPAPFSNSARRAVEYSDSANLRLENHNSTREKIMEESNKLQPGFRHWWPALATILFLVGITYFAMCQRPLPRAAGLDAPDEQFSAARAMMHLRQIATSPHPTGTLENERVASYITQQVVEAGLQPEVQDTSFINQQPRGYVIAHVRNIAAIKKGYSNTRPIMLVAHYDTVVTSPGAGDDGAAVACLLETLRAVKSVPQLKNDVIFLFTDGEELGTVGARAFVAQHPLAGNIGVVLNFEARGTTGPSILFETLNGSGWLVNEFIHVAPHAYGNSLLPLIYKFMPHNTDLSAFKETGAAGMNFAFAEKWSHYHTPLDSLDSLDERSLQHHGEYAIALTRQLGDIDLSNPPTYKLVFFNLIGGILVHYPMSWTPVLTALVALFSLTTIIVGVRKKRLSVPGLLVGFGGLLLAVVLSTLLAAIGVRIAASVSQEGVALYESGFYDVGIICLALAVSTLLYTWLFRKTRTDNLHQGALLGWLALTVASTILLPEAAHIFVWPLLIGVALSLYFQLRPVDRDLNRITVLWLAAFLVLLLLVPMVHLILIAMAGPMSFLATIVVVLIAALLLPIQRSVSRPGAVWLPSLLGTSAAVLLAIAIVGAKAGPAYPKEDHVLYIANLDQGKSIWATLEQKEDAWTSQFFAGQGSISELSKFIPDWIYPGGRVLQRASPMIDLTSPAVSIVEDKKGDNIRRLKFLINSPRRSPEVSIFVESDVAITELDPASGQSGQFLTPVGLKDVSGGDSAQQNSRRSVKYYGLPKTGATLMLETRVAAPIKIHVIERSYNLPTIPNFEVKSRSAGFQVARSLGDGTITYRSFTF
jgi:subfamily B ATP-binding cassette protein MsbA